MGFPVLYIAVKTSSTSDPEEANPSRGKNNGKPRVPCYEASCPADLSKSYYSHRGLSRGPVTDGRSQKIDVSACKLAIAQLVVDKAAEL